MARRRAGPVGEQKITEVAGLLTLPAKADTACKVNERRREALARLDAGETQADIARSYNVDATTIGRLR